VNGQLCDAMGLIPIQQHNAGGSGPPAPVLQFLLGTATLLMQKQEKPDAVAAAKEALEATKIIFAPFGVKIETDKGESDEAGPKHP
jgi:hypothetical protein